MKPLVMPVDTERLVKDYLAEVMADVDCTVGIGVPEGWAPGDTKHLEVASDGVPIAVWPIFTRTTIRLVARAGSTTEAKELCALGLGYLLAHNGDGVIVGTRYLTGPLPARDPETKAELAAATASVRARTEPIEIGS